MRRRFYLALLAVFAINFGHLKYNIFENVLSFVNGPQEPEKKMNAPEIIGYHGFPVETHTVTTEDGYILTQHRIPHGKSGPCTHRQPVIIQHGIFVSSVSWLLNTPDKNLPYLLADAGYDVWITNIRGNEYGLNHIIFHPNQADFWQFSGNELGTYDMPSVVDYIIQTTGAEQIVYIGHSMGTSIVFGMLSLKPQYNDKIKAVFALAPVGVATHCKSMVKYVASGIPLRFLKLIGSGKVLFDSMLHNTFIDAICTSSFTRWVCIFAVCSIMGCDLNQVNQSRIDLYLNFIPTSTSVLLLEHYGQLLESDDFFMFDYKENNQKRYNQSTPPVFDMTKIKVPVALFWGDNDWLATPEDVAIMAPRFRNLILNYKINYDGFTHIDFLFANDVVSLVYDPLIAEIKKLVP